MFNYAASTRPPCQKRRFGSAHYRVARKRGSARRQSQVFPLIESLSKTFYCKSTDRKPRTLNFSGAPLTFIQPPRNNAGQICAAHPPEQRARSLCSLINKRVCRNPRERIFCKIRWALIFTPNKPVKSNVYALQIQDG